MNNSYASFFDPADIPNIRTDIDEDEMETIEEEKRNGSEKTKQSHKRIMEKIKKITQSFSNAITNCGRSGSRQIVLEHYDNLTSLFSVSASVEPFKFASKKFF